MTDRQPDLTWFSPKVEKRKSPIEGRGLFAKANIERGEVVVVKGGYVLTRHQRDEIDKELGPSEIQITEDLFIGPATASERKGGMMHLNHSCEPNLGLQGQIVYVALRAPQAVAARSPARTGRGPRFSASTTAIFRGLFSAGSTPQ